MSVSRLPVPGSDHGNWGEILNDFLTQAHNDDGSLKPQSVLTAGALDKPTADTLYVAQPADGTAAGAVPVVQTDGSVTYVDQSWQETTGGIMYAGSGAAAYTSPTALFSESFTGVAAGAKPTNANTSYDNTIGDNADADGITGVAGDASGVSGNCVRFANATPIGTEYGFLGKNFTARTKMYLRRYVKISALPTYRTSFILAKYGGIHGAHCGSVAVGGTGQKNKFVLVNVDTNSTVTSHTVPVNEWFRVEWLIDLAAATQTLRIFLGANLHGTVPDETITAPVGGKTVDYIEDGILTQPDTLINLWIDEVANDSSKWCGPLQTAGNVTIAQGSLIANSAQFNAMPTVAGQPLSYSQPQSFMPPSGSYLMPANILTTTNGVPTPGLCVFVPFDIGPASFPLNGLVLNVQAAQVGGSTSVTLGLYPDDGSGGLPDCSQGPLVSGGIDPKSLNAKVASVSVTTLQPGRYWACLLYVVGSKPTTVPHFTCQNASSGGVSLWNSAATFPNFVRYIALAGQTALPAVQPEVSNWTLGTDNQAWLLALRSA